MAVRFMVPAALVAFLAVLGGCQQGKQEQQEKQESGREAPPSPVALQTDDQKTVYALGNAMARQLEPFALSKDEVDVFMDGLRDGLTKAKPAVDLDAYSKKIRPFAEARQAAVVAKEKEGAKPFLEKAAAEPGAKKTASGLIIKEITPGTGAAPKDTDKVKVHYKGTLMDGTEFDSSYKRNEPATFPLKGVIKCWTEGLQLMKVGGKGQLVCPSDIAYGNAGRPPLIKPGAPLVFEVELIEIVQ
jgi:FKBP-type peptidyl-prolyl cis-trans isomerase